MIFAKLDVCFWRHEKFVRAGPAAAGLWAAALAYLREDETRDAVVPETMLGMLLGLGERDARKLADRLVEIGLFERKGGGYVLLGYAAKNETREQIEARRAATRKRVDTFRRGIHAEKHAPLGNDVNDPLVTSEGNGSCNALQRPLVTGPVPGSDSPSVSVSGFDSRGGEPERGSGIVPTASPDETPSETLPAARPIANASADGAFGLAVAAWAEGVRAATGKPFAMPRAGAELAKLVDAMVAHCPDVGARVEWARAQATEWARAGTGKLSTHSFADWLNTPRERRSRPLPVKQQAPVSGRTWKGGLPDDPWDAATIVGTEDPEVLAMAMDISVEEVKARMARGTRREIKTRVASRNGG